MGYQETLIQTKLKNIPKIQKAIEKENLDYLMDFIGYYYNPECPPKSNDKVYVLIGGDRHPLADFLREKFKAIPVENNSNLMDKLCWEFEFKDVSKWEDKYS